MREKTAGRAGGRRGVAVEIMTLVEERGVGTTGDATTADATTEVVVLMVVSITVCAMGEVVMGERVGATATNPPDDGTEVGREIVGATGSCQLSRMYSNRICIELVKCNFC